MRSLWGWGKYQHVHTSENDSTYCFQHQVIVPKRQASNHPCSVGVARVSSTVGRTLSLLLLSVTKFKKKLPIPKEEEKKLLPIPNIKKEKTCFPRRSLPLLRHCPCEYWIRGLTLSYSQWYFLCVQTLGILCIIKFCYVYKCMHLKWHTKAALLYNSESWDVNEEISMTVDTAESLAS